MAASGERCGREIGNNLETHRDQMQHITQVHPADSYVETKKNQYAFMTIVTKYNVQYTHTLTHTQRTQTHL